MHNLRRPHSRLALILALGWLILAGPVAAAQAAADLQVNPITLDVRVGFDGYVQQNVYFPISVSATNTGDDVSGELRLKIDFDNTTYSRPLDLPRGARKQVTFYSAGLSFAQSVRVEMVQRGRVLAVEEVRIVPIQASTLLVGTWSDTPQALASFAAIKPSSQDTAVAVLAAADLPPVGEGLRALDVLVILNADTGALSDAQQQALHEWVSQGGRLIILGGTSYQRTLAGLSDLTPVLANDSTTATLAPLGGYWPDGFDPQARLEAPLAVGPLADGAEVLVESDDIPLLVGRDLGYGRVDFLAADPSLEPLLSWEGMPGLWRGILSSGEARPGWAYGVSFDNEYAGNAVANVPGISLPSVVQLCGFLLLYAALIGPVNYLVLRRLKRQELAWVTIPSLVLLFSAIAYITGFQLRGSQTIVHRLAVVQYPLEGQTAKIDLLLGIWSPRRARYDVQLEPGFLARPLPRLGSSALAGAPGATIAYDELTEIRDIRVDVGSIQPFVVEGAIPAASPFSSHLEMTSESNGVRVTGEISNLSDVTFVDAALVMNRGIYRIGRVDAGEVIQIDQRAAYPLAAGSPIDPYPYNPYGGPQYFGYNDLVTGVAGTTDCWSESANRRRCDLVSSLVASENYGRGVYLMGWADHVPVETEVLNATSDFIDMALYVVELEVNVAPSLRAQRQIDADQMTWLILDNPQDIYFASPDNFYMTGGTTISLRFEPLPGLYRHEFTTLLLTMNQAYYYDEETTVPTIEIRNFAAGRWDMLVLSWGENIIEQAAAYIDSIGGVEIRITVDDESYLEFNQFDITLLTPTQN